MCLGWWRVSRWYHTAFCLIGGYGHGVAEKNDSEQRRKNEEDGEVEDTEWGTKTLSGPEGNKYKATKNGKRKEENVWKVLHLSLI